MVKVGSIVKGVGTLAGTVLEYNIKMAGEVVGLVANLADKHDIADKSRSISKSLGETLGGATRNVARISGEMVDKAVDISLDTAKKIKESAIKETVIEYGDTKDVDRDKYIDVEYKIIE